MVNTGWLDEIIENERLQLELERLHVDHLKSRRDEILEAIAVS